MKPIIKKKIQKVDIPSPKIIRFKFAILRNMEATDEGDDHFAVQHFSFMDGALIWVGTYDSEIHGVKGRHLNQLFYREEMTEEERIIVDELSLSKLSWTEISDKVWADEMTGVGLWRTVPYFPPAPQVGSPPISIFEHHTWPVSPAIYQLQRVCFYDPPDWINTTELKGALDRVLKKYPAALKMFPDDDESSRDMRHYFNRSMAAELGWKMERLEQHAKAVAS
jgi:hypothetical protein